MGDFSKAANPDLSLGGPTCTAENWSHTDVNLVFGQGIAYIILNNPAKKNLITDAVYAGLRDAVAILHQRLDIQIVVLAAKGSLFSAGDDVKRIQALSNSNKFATGKDPKKEDVDAFVERAIASGQFPNGNGLQLVVDSKTLWNLAMLPQLTIALVTGSALGAGVGLVTCCDLVMASKNAYFNVSEVKQGMLAGMIAPFISSKWGLAKLQSLLVWGKNLTPEDVGANYILQDPKDAQSQLEKICKNMSDCDPGAVAATKRLTYGVAGRPMSDEMIAYLQECVDGEESSKASRPKSPIVPVTPPPWQ